MKLRAGRARLSAKPSPTGSFRAALTIGIVLLAVQLGTDPAATPCTQTTRMPGFFNHKREPSHLITVDYHDRSRAFRTSDFPRTRATSVLRPDRPVVLTLPSNRMERAARYLAAVPPAISGQHGDLRTFQVCCRLTRGFALSDDAAFVLLAEWNRQCEPPWTERDLRDKLRRSRAYGREPVGGLLADAS